MRTKAIIFIIVWTLFLVFLIQNSQVVTLQLYFWKISMSRIILMAITALIGFLLGFIAAGMKRKNL
jgi:putative membrane protein